jgi:hypothetical protein
VLRSETVLFDISIRRDNHPALLVAGHDMTKVATPEQGIAGGFRPSEPALGVEMYKVPALKNAPLTWQDSRDVLRMQRHSIFPAQFAPASTAFIHAVPLRFLFRFSRLPSAHSWTFLAYWSVALE